MSQGRSITGEGTAYAHGPEAGVTWSSEKASVVGTVSSTSLLPGPLLPASDSPSPDAHLLDVSGAAQPHCLAFPPHPSVLGLSRRLGLPRCICLFSVSPHSPSASERWLSAVARVLPGPESQLCHLLPGEAEENCPFDSQLLQMENRVTGAVVRANELHVQSEYGITLSRH